VVVWPCREGRELNEHTPKRRTKSLFFLSLSMPTSYLRIQSPQTGTLNYFSLLFTLGPCFYNINPLSINLELTSTKLPGIISLAPASQHSVEKKAREPRVRSIFFIPLIALRALGCSENNTVITGCVLIILWRSVIPPPFPIYLASPQSERNDPTAEQNNTQTLERRVYICALKSVITARKTIQIAPSV
jgi:hypothetical protein